MRKAMVIKELRGFTNVVMLGKMGVFRVGVVIEDRYTSVSTY